MRKTFATLRRTATVVAGASVITVMAASAALAFDSGGTPSAPGPDTITWTGQGATNGVLNTSLCSADDEPNGQPAGTPYMLWVLTTDHGSVQMDNATPTITLGGSGGASGTFTHDSTPNSAHFVTPYFTPDSSLTATVNMIVADIGNGAPWNLLLSHGCAGTVVQPKANPLTIDKTAAGTYDTAYKWTIAKTVDKPEIDTADGNATFNYTVTVTHDNGANSNVQVNGKIDVANPNPADAAVSGLTDTLSDGTVCNVDTSGGLTVPANGDKLFRYSCDLGSTLPSGSLDNNAVVSWDDQPLSGTSGLAAGQADVKVSGIQFAQDKVINRTVTVTDPLGGGTIGTLDATKDPASVDFPYPHTFTGDPAGTCTSHDNTATISETGQNASQAVKVCVGTDLTVKKDATPSFDRKYNWKIAKAVKETVLDPGGTAHYTVTVNQDPVTPFADSNQKVKGTITVNNPNNWEDIKLGDLSDAINGGPNCTLDGGSAAGTVIPASQSVAFPYTCSLPSSANGTNTATATWDASAAFTPDGSASGSKDFVFGSTPANTVNKTVTVTDPNAPSNPLGTAGPASDDPSSLVSQDFHYSKTFSPPASGCVTVNNIATIIETGQNASASVKNCNTGALTMGFWQNKNGQALITGADQTALKAFLTGYNPFKDDTGVNATYITNVIKAANASGASMNAMLKAQMLSTALDVYFSDPALGGNKIGAPAPVGGVTIDLTHVCSNPLSCTTFINAGPAFGGANSLKVSEILSYESGQSNSGGSAWYGQVKATQELAKDTNDAINNQVVSGP